MAPSVRGEVGHEVEGKLLKRTFSAMAVGVGSTERKTKA